MKYIEKPCEAVQIPIADGSDRNTGGMMSLIDKCPDQILCYGYRQSKANLPGHIGKITRVIVLCDGSYASTGDWLVLDASGKLYIQSDEKFKRCYRPVENEAFGGFRPLKTIVDELIAELDESAPTPKPSATAQNPLGAIPQAVRDLDVATRAFVRWPSDRNRERLQAAILAADAEI